MKDCTFESTYAVWEEPVDHGDFFSIRGKIYDRETNKKIADIVSRRPKLAAEELMRASEPFERLRAKMVREGHLPPAQCDADAYVFPINTDQRQ